MADKFSPKEFDINSINGGNRFRNGDGVSAEAINAPIEASAYAQALATNQPDTTNANNVGTPTVSIQKMADGTPQFKFENLKGDKGDKGDKGSIYVYNIIGMVNANILGSVSEIMFYLYSSKPIEILYASDLIKYLEPFGSAGRPVTGYMHSSDGETTINVFSMAKTYGDLSNDYPITVTGVSSAGSFIIERFVPVAELFINVMEI